MRATTAPAFRTLESLTFRIGRLLAHYAVVNLTPGLKITPFTSRNIEIGAGASLPITSDEEFDVRTILSIFYHF